MTDEAAPFPGLEPRLRSHGGMIPTEQQSMHSIAISLKRIADRLCPDEGRPCISLAEILLGRN